MVLKNNKGSEKEFNVLLTVNKNGNNYILYKDLLTDNIYGGILKDELIEPLEDDDYDFLEEILETIEG